MSPSVFNRILETIDLTTTSKLQPLEVRDSQMTQTEMETKYKSMMQHIRLLKIFSKEITSIPSNILDLDADIRRTHLFPHVGRYKLTLCVFEASPSSDLRNLTSLTVTTAIMLHNGTTVYLLALRRLSFRSIATGGRVGFKFEAPILETLHLLHTEQMTTNGNDMIHILSHDETLLPNPLRYLRIYLQTSSLPFWNSLDV